MKKYTSVLLSSLLLFATSVFAEVYNPNGKLFILQGSEAKGSKIVKMFRVDDAGKTTIVYSANPGGDEDPAKEFVVMPDLMDGTFKIEGEKLYFYTTDQARNFLSNQKIDELVNPIGFYADQYSLMAGREKDPAKRDKLRANYAYMVKMEDAKKIEYQYLKDCDCLMANVQPFGALPDDHLYNGKLIKISPEQKNEYIKKILPYRHELYARAISPANCVIRENTEPTIHEGVCVQNLDCNVDYYGFKAFSQTRCQASYCNGDKPDVTGCFNDDSKKLNSTLEKSGLKKSEPDFEGYQIK